MKTIILFLALTWAIYAFYYWRRRCRNERPDPNATGNFFACGFIAALAGFFIAIFLSAILPDKIVEENRPLVAIGSTNGRTGSYIRAVSGLLGVPVYRVYIRNDDGSLSTQIVPGNAFIIEDADLHNQAIWRKTWSTKDRSSAAAGWTITFNEVWDTRHYLLVPSGTFVQ